MKNLSVFLKALIINAVLTSIINFTYGQLSIVPNESFGVCPGVNIIYTTLDNNHSMTNCMYSWTVTNGVILEGSTTNGVSTFQGTVNFNMLEKLYK